MSKSTGCQWVYMRCCEVDTVSHLLLGCSFTREVWNHFHRFRAHCILPYLVNGLTENWHFGQASQRGSILWNCTVVDVLWHLWLDKPRTFQDLAPTEHEKVQLFVISWATATKECAGISIFYHCEESGMVMLYNSTIWLFVADELWGLSHSSQIQFVLTKLVETIGFS